jgi:hypothetical protein
MLVSAGLVSTRVNKEVVRKRERMTRGADITSHKFVAPCQTGRTAVTTFRPPRSPRDPSSTNNGSAGSELYWSESTTFADNIGAG